MKIGDLVKLSDVALNYGGHNLADTVVGLVLDNNVQVDWSPMSLIEVYIPASKNEQRRFRRHDL